MEPCTEGRRNSKHFLHNCHLFHAIIQDSSVGCAVDRIRRISSKPKWFHCQFIILYSSCVAVITTTVATNDIGSQERILSNLVHEKYQIHVRRDEPYNPRMHFEH